MIIRDRFPISELVARTGVPAATIHHYLRSGLLPAPRRSASNLFLYDERHEQGVRLIRTLRARRRLPLADIRRILPELLQLEAEQAFRPEMWDRAAGLHLRRDARRAPARRILSTAVEAFSRRGYAAVNVDDLCRSARVAKGSFYRHFRSKEELFFAVCEAVAGEISERFAQEIDRGAGSRESAADVLAEQLQPRLPILLDLVGGAVQNRPGYRPVARRVLGELAHELGGVRRSQRRPLEAGTSLLQHAVGRLLGRLVSPASSGVDAAGA